MVPDSALSCCWIVETARSMVLSSYGMTNAATRGAARARALASACARRGLPLQPRVAELHARWIEQVAGDPAQTGPLASIFLDRLGNFVDLHAGEGLGEPDLFSTTIAPVHNQDDQNFTPPVMESHLIGWPSTPPAKLQGELVAKFNLVTDPHIGVEGADKCLITAINTIGAETCVLLGDLTQSGTPELIERAHEIVKSSGADFHATLGNHDMFSGKGPELFHSTFGAKPYIEFETEGVRFILLDSTNPSPSPYPPFNLMTGEFYDAPNESVPGGRFSEEVVEFMHSIKKGVTTFIGLHHPPYPYSAFPPLIFGLDEESTKHLQAVCVKINAQAIFCGHTHRCSLDWFGKTPIFEIPSVRDWPFGFGVLEISSTDWTYNLTPSGIIDKADIGPSGYLFRRYALGPEESRSYRGSLLNE